MAVRTLDDILAGVRAQLSDDTADDALTLLEDISDTINNSNNNSSENWEQRYRENDANWRKKYRDRFFGKGSDEDDDEPGAEEPNKPLLYENLFKEG